ncbi:MAG: nicotinate (nicotinamide) nucleotide adenylyltransferase [Phycisphaerales bacterium]|mgnify:CR=1 FL=1|nr:nicotinate (nicotinamide) nucleotide adenylyltransferase [Phycisphaerales bacterium]
MNSTSPILIFGGSFDPPTRAHVTLPPLAARSVGAELLLYVPASISPHKLDSPPSPAVHRVAMLELALADVDGTAIDTLELDRTGPSYSVDTVKALRSKYGSRVRLLIGDDQALSFHRWKDWESIMEVAEPMVLPRRHATREDFIEGMLDCDGDWDEAAIERWAERRIELPCMTMCSQDARIQLQSGGDADEELDPDVRNYIRERGLYQ